MTGSRACKRAMRAREVSWRVSRNGRYTYWSDSKEDAIWNYEYDRANYPDARVMLHKVYVPR